MIKRIEPDQQYTRLTVKAKVDKKGNNVVWLCSCICGQETEVRADNLRSGKIVSCGCYRLSKFTTNEDNINRALSLFNDGFSVFQIAQRMKVSPSNIQKFLNASGIEVTVLSKTLKTYRFVDKENWCVLYCDWGMSITEIAVYAKTTIATVLNVLNKNGVKTRDKGQASPRMISDVKAKVEQYKLLYEQGFTIHEIAERFNRTYQAVAYLLTSHGCTLRNRKEEAQIQRIRHKKEVLGLIECRSVKLSETAKAPRLREIENKLRSPLKRLD